MTKAAEDEHAYDHVLRVMIVAFMKGMAGTTAARGKWPMRTS
jgi:hypothetical protein